MAKRKRLTHDNKPTELYGIDRWCTAGGHWSWAVNLTRRLRNIRRVFYDTAYGGEDEALAEAKAYRDAVMNLFPATTNHEKARRLQERNTSGVPGVLRVIVRNQAYWKACLTRPDGIKRASFSIKKYGERRAKAMAIAARQEMLAEMEVAFLISSDEGRKGNDATYPEILDDSELAVDKDNLARLMAEGEAQLVKINAEFDARRPIYINLRLAVHPMTRSTQLRLRIGDGKDTLPLSERCAFIPFGPRRRSLKQALALTLDRTREIIERLHGRDILDDFLRRHGKAFEEKNFDIVNGVTIRDRVARDVTQTFQLPLTAAHAAQPWPVARRPGASQTHNRPAS